MSTTRPLDNTVVSLGSSFNEMISQNAAVLSSEHRGQIEGISLNSSGLSNCLDSLNNNNSSSSSMLSSKNDLFIGQQLSDEDWNPTLPTPPRSPESSQATDEDNTNDLKERDLIELIGEAEALAILEDIGLDFSPIDDFLSSSPSSNSWNPQALLHNSLASASQPSASSSELRHDCMWSGDCDHSCKQQRIRYPSENSDIQLLTPASSPLRHCGTGSHLTSDLKFSTEQSELEAVSVSNFVDPSAVLSYTPHSDHCYYQPNARQNYEADGELSNGQPITVATPGPSPKRSTWRKEQYVLSDTPSESDDSDESESNDDDEEEIDVVSIQSAPLASHAHNATNVANGQQQLQQMQMQRAHQRSLTSHTASSQRSLLKSKNSLKTAAHKQRKQKNAGTVANVSVTNNALPTPVTPYLLTPASSPQPAGNPIGPTEYPMPKVTSSGRIVQPTNRSVSFLEAQPQHSSRGEHHSRKRKRNNNENSHSVRPTKHGRNSGSNRTCDIEDPEKRREHNSMERKRRDDLRFAFQKLRELVPELKDNPKAAKVTILSKAAEYSLRLQQQQKQFEMQISHEERRRRQLLKTLAALQHQHRSANSQGLGASALSV
ncbi:uncharacterized protein LOC111265571 isoform X2 [Varroa jacobsoni]|uniref:uncharacterized protein LOC111265571 isoform X2 n=1 Tax=Varroa jacobsoni TaxID=62625 RepID=UPI000BF6AF4E|nr:uncharacterized protein LOC111265571 isoform X2 [Varroa jacobsoni]